MKKQEEVPKKNNRIIIAAIIILALFILATIMSSCVILFEGLDTEEIASTGNVALIEINGFVSIGNDNAGFLGDTTTSSETIVEYIRDANEDPTIKAIIFEINGYGSTPVAADEVVQEIKRTNLTTVAWVREVAASGPYWMATAADHIIANRMSIVGSVGVLGSQLDFSGLLRRYNVTYRKLTAGEHKDMGTPFREMTKEEEMIVQKRLNKMQDFFITDVAQNRNLSESAVNEIIQGDVYLGIEGLELGLVDELGGEYEVKEYLKKTLNITPELKKYKTRSTLRQILSQMAAEHSFQFGRGFASFLLNEKTNIIT